MQQDTQLAQIFGVVLAGVLAAWVIADAMRRGKSSGEALLWGLGVFCLCIAFLPAYLIGRMGDAPNVQNAQNNRQSTLCRYCGLYNEGDPIYCAHCSRQLKGVGGPPTSNP
jgi:hypothetical protein